MGSSIPSNWQSGVYKRDKRNPHFLFPSRMTQKGAKSAPAMITLYLSQSSPSSNAFLLILIVQEGTGSYSAYLDRA